MKPHIRKTRGVWVCDMRVKCMGRYHGKRYVFLPYDRNQPVGHGYTPREAYADWQEQNRAARNAATT